MVVYTTWRLSVKCTKCEKKYYSIISSKGPLSEELEQEKCCFCQHDKLETIVLDTLVGCECCECSLENQETTV